VARPRTKSNENSPEAVDHGPLEDWVGFNLRVAQTAAFQAFSRRSQEIGERPGLFAALTLIGTNPGISQTALSRANGRDKSTLTPVLTDLVRRRLVRRDRSPTDKRTYRLNLTPAGRRVLQKLTACARRHEAKLDKVIGARDRARFVQILRKIANEMT
jgi:DNA-binding MarR family transcriptional regulator